MRYNFQISNKQINPKEEHFIVVRADRKWIFRSNRPLFRNRGVRHRIPDFALIEGESNNRHWQEEIMKGIAAHIKLAEEK